MKIGEIKAEALMIMGINNNANISWTDIESYKEDPTYNTYVHAMVGAINRCLLRFYIVGAIEAKPLSVSTETGEITEITEFSEDVDDILANMIPLYVVGDVFALDEPSVAQNKRNEFEELLAEYIIKRAYPLQDQVDIVYGDKV